MTVEGQERTVAVYGGNSWLVIERADLEAGRFQGGATEVVIASKIERTGSTFRLTGMPGVQVVVASSMSSPLADGDNAWLFGHLSRGEDGPRLTVVQVAAAPSDRQRIAKRIESIARNDWQARLKGATWIREQAAYEPNKEFWLAAADEATTRTIEDAVTAATPGRDLALVDQAITWAVDVVRDPGLAGRVASIPWLVAESDPTLTPLHRRMRHLGLELYKDQWLPRPDALAKEFEDRFLALKWNEAEGFFRLGRWADVHADGLPLAKDRAYRAYRAGLRADPAHAGIRAALGIGADNARADAAASGSAAPVGLEATPEAPSVVPLNQAKPNPAEMAKEGWQLAQHQGALSVWMNPPRAEGEGMPAQIRLMFWCDGTEAIAGTWSVEYAGATSTATVQIPSRARLISAIPVIYRSNSAPLVSFQAAAP